VRRESGRSLLDDVVAAASDPHVLDIDGVESEVRIGLAALHESLDPLLHDLPSPPQPKKCVERRHVLCRSVAFLGSSAASKRSLRVVATSI
jgi:hypothetical protein